MPLAERVRKARRVQADLFVSIHADAFMTPEARGASVFALSDSAAPRARRALDRRARRTRPTWSAASTCKAKDQTVLRALLDMSTTAQIKDSLKLGGEVLGRIGSVGTPAQAAASSRPASRC